MFCPQPLLAIAHSHKVLGMEDLDRDDARAQRSTSQGPFYVTNKLADSSIGIKFASLCTVSCVPGLALFAGLPMTLGSPGIVDTWTSCASCLCETEISRLSHRRGSHDARCPFLTCRSPSGTKSVNKASPTSTLRSLKAYILIIGSYWGLRKCFTVCIEGCHQSSPHCHGTCGNNSKCIILRI